FGNYDERQLLDSGKVKSFVKSAGAHTAVTYVGNRDDRFLLHACAQQHARHYRNHVTQMRDRTNKALAHIAEVNIEIAATRWPPGLRHILGKDIPRSNSLHQHRAKIANQRGDKIRRFQSVSTSDRGCFLPQRTKDTAYNFRLPVEID